MIEWIGVPHEIVRALHGWGLAALTAGQSALRWASHHTGLPMVVVAAMAIVVGWRVAKRTWHIALEFALALGLLLLATKAGWIRW